MATLIAAAAAAVALGPAHLAAASSFEVPPLPGPAGSPASVAVVAGGVPVGDGVVYAAGSHAQGWTLWLAAPGAPRRRLAVIAPAPGSSFDQVVLRASPTRLVVARHAGVCDGDRCASSGVVLDQLLAGPLDGPLTPICPGAACTGGPRCSSGGPGYAAVLDGDLLGVSDLCTQAAGVTDLATGAGRMLGAATALAVAGRFVAVAALAPYALPAGFLTTIVVRDATSGAEIYRPALPAINFAQQPQFALLPDGTLVYAASASGGEAIVVASPAAPAGRVLRYVPGGSSLDGVGPGGVLIRSVTTGLELDPLDGRPAASPPFTIPDLLAAPAFDGHTVVWAQRLCVTTTITSWRLADPPPSPADVRCPTPRPPRSAVTLGRDNRLRASLTCPALTRGGCQASVLFTGLRRRGATGRRSYRLGRVDIALDPGTRGFASLRVPSRAARWVRRYAPLRLRVLIRSALCCPEQRPPGDTGSATGTVALRVAR